MTSLNTLSLSRLELTAVPDLTLLKVLTSLNLSGNQLTEVPSLAALEDTLISLDLSDNPLGSVPDSVGGLAKLTTLKLHNNQLTAVPDLEALTELVVLDMSGNYLTKVEGLGTQTILTTLNLSDNKLTAVPEGVEKLKSLTTLNLAGNNISSLPEDMADLGKLKDLDLSDNPIRELPDWLKDMGIRDVKYGSTGGTGGGVDSWLQVVLGSSQVVYTGKPVNPGITVKNDSSVLRDGVDYTVSYQNNVNVGTATGTIKIVGSSHSTNVSFQVVPAPAAGLAAVVSDVQWTGKQVKPAPKVTFGGIPLLNGTDYTLSYGANKAIGKGSVNVVGKGNFAGVKSVAFKVVPKKNKVSKATAGKKQVAVSWSKVSKSQKVSKYEVRYRAKGTSKWTTKSFAAKTAKATVKKLRKGKVYQFQVRSFKTVSGAKYYSPWSAVKASKKVK